MIDSDKQNSQRKNSNQLMPLRETNRNREKRKEIRKKSLTGISIQYLPLHLFLPNIAK